MSPEKSFLRKKKKSFFGEVCFIGADEVGRGALAGPVVACSLKLKVSPSDFIGFERKLRLLGVCDSKKLTHKKRASILETIGVTISQSRLFQKIHINNYQFEYKLEQVSPKVIDKINILQASLLAFKKSSEYLLKNEKEISPDSHIILIDGNKLPEFSFNCSREAVIKGDQSSVLIGLASIIAKEWRDQLMGLLGEDFCQYGFKQHSGYPTKKHREAIKQYGPTAFHRNSFKLL